MASASDKFFEMIPRRSVWVLLGAIFCVFAPIGVLLVSSFKQPWPPGSILLLCLLSGAIAVSWAGTYILSRWFIAGIVVFTPAIMIASGLLSRALPDGTREFSWVSFGLIALIVLGYILFLTFIGGQGRSTVRLMTEMDLARRIHLTLVPPIASENARLEAVGFSSASSEMGGDLIDMIEHASSTDLFLADVSGHGVSAGVVMGMIKASIRQASLDKDDLDRLFGRLNTVLEQTTSPELYATMAALRIEHDATTVTCVLAGHHHILHCDAAGSRLERIENRHLPIGLMAGTDYTTLTVPVAQGDLFVVYTDGLNETTDADEHELGHAAVERVIAKHAGSPLTEIQRAVFDLVDAHGAQVDDRTLLLVRLK